MPLLSKYNWRSSLYVFFVLFLVRYPHTAVVQGFLMVFVGLIFQFPSILVPISWEGSKLLKCEKPEKLTVKLAYFGNHIQALSPLRNGVRRCLYVPKQDFNVIACITLDCNIENSMSKSRLRHPVLADVGQGEHQVFDTLPKAGQLDLV